MSFRSALGRKNASLQPEYVTHDPASGGREAVFRFSVPVLRVRDVATTVSWYRRHLGFAAESFPERTPHEFAIIERDGVQLLVRAHKSAPRRRSEPHSGWDLYIWVDGLDLTRLQNALTPFDHVVRPLSPMGSNMAELEIRDPDGYVLCIGGPLPATTAASPRDERKTS